MHHRHTEIMTDLGIALCLWRRAAANSFLDVCGCEMHACMHACMHAFLTENITPVKHFCCEITRECAHTRAHALKVSVWASINAPECPFGHSGF